MSQITKKLLQIFCLIWFGSFLAFIFGTVMYDSNYNPTYGGGGPNKIYSFEVNGYTSNCRDDVVKNYNYEPYGYYYKNNTFYGTCSLHVNYNCHTKKYLENNYPIDSFIDIYVNTNYGRTICSTVQYSHERAKIGFFLMLPFIFFMLIILCIGLNKLYRGCLIYTLSLFF